MNNYKLKENEVVLYKGDITFLESLEKAKLILTNINIVFVSKEDNEVELYPIEEIKIYEGVPQIKTKGNKVELYLISTEKEIKFTSLIELNKFIKATIQLLTGKNTAERCAEKVKQSIKLVNDTLGIDIVGATGNIIKNGVVGSVLGIREKTKIK